MRKPRHNPEKRQNNYGDKCSYYETHVRTDGTVIEMCECGGNRHNCELPLN